MTNKKNPTVIKKYANRRLYHTGSSSYVTLEDLSIMVRNGEDFIVVDAKSGEDITHNILTQIIFEEENKGHNMLPTNFLRQLISFYGDSMQTFIPHYLEASLESVVQNQEKLRTQFQDAFGVKTISAIEHQVRNNMEIMEQAFRMFTPFNKKAEAKEDETQIDTLKRQLAELNKRLSALEGS